MLTIHQCRQGGQEWLALRAEHKTASEVPAMMNVSSYQTRDELMQVKKTGITPEINAHTQKLFDRGHAIEAFARPLAEAFIDEELYPVTGSDFIDGLNLLASYDGLTILQDISWECKSLNAKLREALPQGAIPYEYRPQLEQQVRLAGAEKCLFTASDGTEKGTMHIWYYPDDELWSQILAGWAQFNKDLIDFVPVIKEVKPAANAIMALPTLSISIAGEVSSSNLAVYEKTALDFIKSINTDLQTDQDFVDAEAMVKFCKKAEEELEVSKKAALGQTADIDQLFKTVDHLQAELKVKRLAMDKTVKARKEVIKVEIVTEAQAAISKFYDDVFSEFKDHVMVYGTRPDFASAIKGKRNIDSMRGAINDLTAKTKIDVNERASIIRANLITVNAEPDYKMLFSDLQQIIEKAPDDFKLLVESRINGHKVEEKRKDDERREEIRKEEAKKAQKVIDDKKIEDDRIAQEVEDQRIAGEQEEQSDDNKDDAGNEPPKQKEQQEQAETKPNVDKKAAEPVSNAETQAATSAIPQSITPKRAVANLIEASMEYGYRVALEDNGLELEDDSIGDFAKEMLSNATEDGGMLHLINPVMDLMNGAGK